MVKTIYSMIVLILSGRGGEREREREKQSQVKNRLTLQEFGVFKKPNYSIIHVIS